MGTIPPSYINPNATGGPFAPKQARPQWEAPEREAPTIQPWAMALINAGAGIMGNADKGWTALGPGIMSGMQSYLEMKDRNERAYDRKYDRARDEYRDELGTWQDDRNFDYRVRTDDRGYALDVADHNEGVRANQVDEAQGWAGIRQGDERLGLERDRFGLERDRFGHEVATDQRDFNYGKTQDAARNAREDKRLGYEGERVRQGDEQLGLERDRFGYQQRTDQRDFEYQQGRDDVLDQREDARLDMDRRRTDTYVQSEEERLRQGRMRLNGEAVDRRFNQGIMLREQGRLDDQWAFEQNQPTIVSPGSTMIPQGQNPEGIFTAPYIAKPTAPPQLDGRASEAIYGAVAGNMGAENFGQISQLMSREQLAAMNAARDRVWLESGGNVEATAAAMAAAAGLDGQLYRPDEYSMWSDAHLEPRPGSAPPPVVDNSGQAGQNVPQGAVPAPPGIAEGEIVEQNGVQYQNRGGYMVPIS